MYEKREDRRTELSELGEFGLIRHLTEKAVPRNASTVKGVGDDAAVLDFGGKRVLVSTDLLAEGVHFDLSYTPLKHLGYKAVTSNVSDIAAMNGTARQIIVGISVSNRFSVEALEELYSGIYLACDRYGLDLAGGDTTSSAAGLFISVTVIGEAADGDIVYRHTAKPDDLVCVTGDLGGAYMGLMVLEREKAVFKADPGMQPDLKGNEYILGRQLKPEPRTDILMLLREAGLKPTSMIDISDGLASEIIHICENSGTSCRLYEEKIPVHPATAMVSREFNIDPVTCALNGGEDYELLFTISQADYQKVAAMPGVSVIGHLMNEEEGIYMVTRSGGLVPLEAQGWDALRKRKQDL